MRLTSVTRRAAARPCNARGFRVRLNASAPARDGTVTLRPVTSEQGNITVRENRKRSTSGTTSTAGTSSSSRDGTVSLKSGTVGVKRVGTVGTGSRILRSATRRVARREVVEAEQTIKDSLANVKGRGAGGLTEEQQAAIEDAVATLEQDCGILEPTLSPLLDGKWRLLYTSRPGTSSPIQRTFTAVDAFQVYQEVELGEQFEVPRVTNVVDFGSGIGVLRVEALASTDSRPLEDFIPRQDEGIALFGKSFLYPPAAGDMRIDFQFDNAFFKFSFLPFPLPYPVPFRLLGDECKGWVDVTYLSADGSFRLSRGNKGTLFILSRDVPAASRLILAIQDGQAEQVQSVIEEMAAANPTPSPAESELAQGTWRLIWSQQSKTANALQKWGSSQSESFQVIEGGNVQNIAQLLPFLRLRAYASTAVESEDRTAVSIERGVLEVGPFTLPLPGVRGEGYIDWLYLDDELRITRGSEGSVFVHMREPEEGEEAAEDEE